MRELEFLPGWYPRLARRKRMVALQLWLTLVVVGGVGLYWLLAHRNVQRAEGALVNLQAEMSQTALDLRKLDDLLALQKQWRQQDQVIAKLGLHVEATRMINALEAAMPPEMSLTQLSIEVQEQSKAETTLARLRQQQKKEEELDRRLKVKVSGLAPTDVDLANFLAKLSGGSYFEDVTMTYAKERMENGHLMREFEVTLAVNLNGAAN